MKRLLFIRHFQRPTGGNVSVRDYFFHALADPRFDTRIWFAPGSRHLESDLWHDLPSQYVVAEPEWDSCDFVFVNGKDWRLLPAGDHSFRIIHLVQHLGYAGDSELRAYLARPALRICLSDAARDSIAPYAAGPLRVIPSGVDPALFHDRDERVAGHPPEFGTTQLGDVPPPAEAGHHPRELGTTQLGDVPPPAAAHHPPGFGTTQSCPTPPVLIWGGKSPEVAAAIRDRLAAHGVSAEVVDGWLSRRDFAARLRRAGIFVGLSQPREGFYRPALEAMACGCAVVCSDALGNRAHCIDGVTCLQPPHGDAEAHAGAVLRLLSDHGLAERLRRKGRALSQQFSLDVERARLHAVFGELLNGI